MCIYKHFKKLLRKTEAAAQIKSFHRATDIKIKPFKAIYFWKAQPHESIRFGKMTWVSQKTILNPMKSKAVCET